jgi:hypothetical protein
VIIITIYFDTIHIKSAKGISETKRVEVTGSWRKCNNKFHRLYFSANRIRMIKPWRMRWEWNVARMGEKTNA